MQSRPSRALATPAAASNLTFLDVSADYTRPVPLSQDGTLVVEGGDGWGVKVTECTDGTVEVRPFSGTAVRVNDVEVRGVAHARAGDLIALPDRSLLVQRFSVAPSAPIVLASHEAFEQRLAEEVDRLFADRSPVSVLIVRSRTLIGDGLREFLSAPEFRELRRAGRSILIGLLAPATLELLCPSASGPDADEIRGHLSEALGRLGRPFRWGWSTAPLDGQNPATLSGRALDRFYAERPEPADESPRADPVMVRLWSLCDVWAGMQGGVLLPGEEGSGRETLARVIHERRALHAPFIVVRSARFDSALWQVSVERARGGTLYLRHSEAVPAFERARFWEATAFRPMAGTTELGSFAPPVVVAVPALRDRPLDVLPIAEHILARCIGVNGSRKPKLTLSARSALSTEWTGSVRNLKSSLQRAALLADASGEVLADHIVSAGASHLGAGPRATDLRASLRGVERKTLLETLAQTNWNVTEAARALGLPRRTVVYRMSRLGLRRPRKFG